MYPITIFDKGGKKIFRKYTEDTLRTMFDSSKLGANYEVTVLIENMVFMALMTYYLLRNDEVEYYDFVLREPMPSLGEGIKKLEQLHLFDEVIEELKKYKDARNAFSHDPFRMKTFIFGQYTVADECERLFEQGMNLLTYMSPLLQPGKPSMDEYKKRFKATAPGNVFTLNIGPTLAKLLDRRQTIYKKKPNRKNLKNLQLVMRVILEEKTPSSKNPVFSSTLPPAQT